PVSLGQIQVHARTDIAVARRAGSEKQHGIFLPDRVGVVDLTEEFRGILELGLELVLHLFPDRVAALPDSRSDGGHEILWSGTELQPHAAYSVFHDARQC